MDPMQPEMSEDRPTKAPASRATCLVLGIGLGVLGVFALSILVVAVSVGIPMVQERSARLQCQRNLSEIGLLWTNWYLQYGDDDPTGSSFVKLLQQRSASLWCPGDPATPAPNGSSPCSYAVRDFVRYPIDDESPERQIIACDRMGDDGKTPHHQDGILVLFDNGSSTWMDREALGLGPDDPIVVGPQSTQPLLKQVVEIGK